MSDLQLEEKRGIIENQDIENINSLISDFYSNLRKIAGEELGLDIGFDGESYITDYIYGELKTALDNHQEYDGDDEVEDMSICPFCGSENTVTIIDALTGMYYCSDCKEEFSKEDAEFEDLRHQVSALCSAHMATEEDPLKCDILLDNGKPHLPYKMPRITSIFHDPYAVVYYTLESVKEPIELDQKTLLVEDLKMIIEKLSETSE